VLYHDVSLFSYTNIFCAVFLPHLLPLLPLLVPFSTILSIHTTFVLSSPSLSLLPICFSQPASTSSAVATWLTWSGCLDHVTLCRHGLRPALACAILLPDVTSVHFLPGHANLSSLSHSLWAGQHILYGDIMCLWRRCKQCSTRICRKTILYPMRTCWSLPRCRGILPAFMVLASLAALSLLKHHVYTRASCILRYTYYHFFAAVADTAFCSCEPAFLPALFLCCGQFHILRRSHAMPHLSHMDV